MHELNNGFVDKQRPLFSEIFCMRLYQWHCRQLSTRSTNILVGPQAMLAVTRRQYEIFWRLSKRNGRKQLVRSNTDLSDINVHIPCAACSSIRQSLIQLHTKYYFGAILVHRPCHILILLYRAQPKGLYLYLTCSDAWHTDGFETHEYWWVGGS